MSSGGMPRPSSRHAEHDVAAAPLGGNRDGLAATRKADRIGQQVEEHLPDALGIRDHRAEARLRLDVEPDLGFGEPVLNAGDGVGDGLADIDRTEHQFDRARIDRCKVENIVDDRHQCR